MVKCLWQGHFGSGLVAALKLRACSATPSHPELLDWLAARSSNTAGRSKTMHSADHAVEHLPNEHRYHDWQTSKQEPDNRLALASQRRRLEAEALRDSTVSRWQLDLASWASCSKPRIARMSPSYPTAIMTSTNPRVPFMPYDRSNMYDVLQGSISPSELSQRRTRRPP